jgi:pyruvate,water dikinase
MDNSVLEFSEIDQTLTTLVGGKGARLGELARIEGVDVPPGFCVTTHAFDRMMANNPSVGEHRARLRRARPDDREAIGAGSAEVRRLLHGVAVPDDVESAVTHALDRLGAEAPYAVRSSATAEDLPAASFAGQLDSYLNVVGRAAIVEHVRRCWASLFNERAVTYRLRNGVDERSVSMAVVVQQMVVPQAAGVLFTADPLTSNRKVTSVEASFGLGEAVVSGLISPDVYWVREGTITSKTVAVKQFAIRAAPGGGTNEVAVPPDRQGQPALTDAQVLRLEQQGRRIESHFGRPQDIEWCLADDEFQIVQSRPITTLFPVPIITDTANHVYVSVGHQQMMTDAMRPLGLAMWQLTTPRPMAEAGGRLFVDVTQLLGSPATSDTFVAAFRRSDPLMGDALQSILERGDFVPIRADDAPPVATPAGLSPADPIHTDPAIVTELIRQSEASLAALTGAVEGKSGPELFEFILEDLQELRRILFDPRSHAVFLSAMEATWWLNEHMGAWLGEKNVADTLSQSVPHNVTSEMGLALLDVADTIRPHREVVAFLGALEEEGQGEGEFLDMLPALHGGRQARDAFQAYLDRFGMRCVGEIDITRPRWSERPGTLVPLLLGNIKNFEQGAGEHRFEQGRREAVAKKEEVLARLLRQSDGQLKADEARQKIDRVRTFIGYREYPKYHMVSRYFVYKQALMREADRFVDEHILSDREDVFSLTFEEFQNVARTNRVDPDLVLRRKEAFSSYEALTPPRVMTSDGEVVAGTYRRVDVPAGALVGLPVSSGTIEGRARVLHDMGEAELEAGDILVTAYTDPSWTPAFVAIGGLVTEVGGLMTHGAVIAREYGLPAVVGVEQATRRIADGQQIRVNGTAGLVEIVREAIRHA